MKRAFPTVALAALLASWTLPQTATAAFTEEQAGRIAQLVGFILQESHYRQVPLDDERSEMFLRNYFDALDYNHMIFLQSDFDEFKAKYEKSLDDLTKSGNVKPAFEIYERFMKRLKDRHDLVTRLVNEKFDFEADASYLPNRHDEPWPANEAEAEQMWRARIKSELLQDRLAKIKNEESQGKPTPEAIAKYDPADAIETISKRYDRLLRNMEEFETEEILQTYLTGLSHAYDPHSSYMSPDEAENFEIHSVKLSLSGIGALLRWEDGYTQIVQTVPGGPAAMSGLLHPNDRIIAVAQGKEEPVDTVEMKLSKVVNMIRGETGTEVRLTIIPADAADDSEVKVISLIRDEIKLTEQHAKARIVERTLQSGTERLGIIILPQFYEECGRDVVRLLDRLKRENVGGIVLDLRRNGGGILDEAVNLTGAFIPTGPVVQVRNSHNQTQVLMDEDPDVAYDGPLVVLVDNLSASASEIVAAALQDYGRAVIVGAESTHGKGTVQTLISVDRFVRRPFVKDAGKMKFTVSKFYRVAGGTTQKQGVTPDIILPNRMDSLEIGEASLPNSLPADRVAALPFKHTDSVSAHLPFLRENSKARVAVNDDFTYIRQDIQRARKQKELKLISLNESARRNEKATIDSQIEARRTERAARPEPTEEIYEITLKAITDNLPLQTVEEIEAEKKAAAEAANPVDPSESDGDEDGSGEGEEDSDEPAGNAPDAQLEESLNILRDLIAVSSGGTPPALVERSTKKP